MFLDPTPSALQDIQYQVSNIQHSILYLRYSRKKLGRIEEESKKLFVQIIGGLESKGAEGVILGCTEISLLIKGEDTPLELFDTTAIHAQAAVDFALKG